MKNLLPLSFIFIINTFSMSILFKIVSESPNLCIYTPILWGGASWLLGELWTLQLQRAKADGTRLEPEATGRDRRQRPQVHILWPFTEGDRRIPLFPKSFQVPTWSTGTSRTSRSPCVFQGLPGMWAHKGPDSACTVPQLRADFPTNQRLSERLREES